MLDNKPLVIGFGVLALAGVVLFVIQLIPGANNKTFPNGLDFICPNGHEFNMTVSQMNEFYEKHYGEEVPCPKCGATPCRRAVRDPKTGKLHVPDRNEGALPVPGQREVPPEGSTEGRR